jgi:hypothetical protein
MQLSTKLKVVGLGDNNGGVNRHLYIRCAERMLFSIPEGEEVDYVRLDIETRFYDPEYERAIRQKKLDLIYFLDDIRLYLDRPISQCIDILIDIEQRLARTQMVGDVRHIMGLEQDVLFLSDLLLTEGAFLQMKLTPAEYAQLAQSAPHMTVPADLSAYLQGFKDLSVAFRKDADRLLGYSFE